MKKDLKIPKVTGVEIAAVMREDDDQLWDIYLINRNGYALENVIISTSGYGEVNGQYQKTSILRHAIELLEAKSYAKIEPIQKEVFHLTNQYWVSFFSSGQMYDKKYIFLPDTIHEKYVTSIKGFDLKGVILK